MMHDHIRDLHDENQTVRGIPAADGRCWETDGPPCAQACEDCLSLLEHATRLDDYQHPPGDATLIDSLRHIVTESQHTKINGVLVDLWSAAITVKVWESIKPGHRHKLLALPPHELIRRCVAIYSATVKKAQDHG